MQVTPDGSYIIAGETFQYGTGIEDILLVKTDASGNEMWNRTIGGTVEGPLEEEATRLVSRMVATMSTW